VKIILKVTDRGFVWQPPTGTPQIAQRLWAPYRYDNEKALVVRNGGVIDVATIETLGTHGSCEFFVGFLSLMGSEAHQSIGFASFKTGDELHIENIPPRFSESDYWREITLEKGADITE